MSQHTRSSLIHKQVGWLFLQVPELSLSSYLWLRWVQLKLISEGRWLVVRASSSSSSSAVLLCHPHHVNLEGFHCQVCIPFCIYRRIWLLSPLDIFCFTLLKHFESLANDRDNN